MEAPHTRIPTTETMDRLTATGALTTEIIDRLTAMEALITEVTDHLTAMGALITEITDRLTAMEAWSWEAIETVMQIATTTDVMQAAEAMQQVEGQEDFAARRPGPRHRTLPMQIIVYEVWVCAARNRGNGRRRNPTSKVFAASNLGNPDPLAVVF
jgi:hypothetical protein